MKLFGFDFTKIFNFIHDLNVIVTTVESVQSSIGSVGTSSASVSEVIKDEQVVEEEGV